jgi:hypothetical protein
MIGKSLFDNEMTFPHKEEKPLVVGELVSFAVVHCSRRLIDALVVLVMDYRD